MSISQQESPAVSANGSPPRLVSVVVPALNEGPRIERTIATIMQVFRSSPHAVEVIVVDDGSTDDTYAQAMALASDAPERLRVVRHERNQGKGAAIRAGFLASRGDVVGFIDADLEYPVAALPVMAMLVAESDSACAIASRVADDRRRLERVSSNIAHRIAAAVLRLPVRDTQAGVKMFPGTFAREILTECQQTGWLYDIEALLKAVEQSLEIIEVPVIQKSVRRRRASLWTMVQCGPTLLSMAFDHWKTLRSAWLRELRQVLRFGMVGGANSLVDIAAFWGLTTAWPPGSQGVQAGFESLLAWVAASLVGYALHSRYTFKRHMARSGFYVVTGVGVAIQVLVTGAATQASDGVDSLVGKVLGMALASLFTYAGYRYLARQPAKTAPGTGPKIRQAMVTDAGLLRVPADGTIPRLGERGVHSRFSGEDYTPPAHDR